MGKVKYQFNSESVSYERIDVGLKDRVISLIKHVLSSLVMAVILVLGLFHFFESPKERALKRENQQLLSQYVLLNRDVVQIKKVLHDLERRDDNIYRVIFEADPIDPSVRKAGYGGVNRYQRLESLDNADLVISTSKKLDQLGKEMYLQSKSYDDVEGMVKNKFKMLASIPAVMPIAIKDFGRISGGFGWRLHPIYKTRKYHHGMDFTGKIGTHIYSTGDGVVIQAGKERGYGRKIVISHGYGYKTIYAHLSGFNVKKGQKVKRGEVIGYLGNSGISTGPHLHYEVRKNNITMNPLNYYFNDITAEEYDRMVEVASNTGQTMD